MVLLRQICLLLVTTTLITVCPTGPVSEDYKKLFISGTSINILDNSPFIVFVEISVLSQITKCINS